MRTFNTVDRPVGDSPFENAKPVTFTIDDDTFTAYPPTESQVAYMLSSQARGRDVTDSIAGVIDFFDGILDKHAQEVFRRRLLDREDPFDFAMVREIIEGLMEEWTARPTKPSRGSTSSRRSTGPKSMEKPVLMESTS